MEAIKLPRIGPIPRSPARERRVAFQRQTNPPLADRSVTQATSARRAGFRKTAGLFVTRFQLNCRCLDKRTFTPTQRQAWIDCMKRMREQSPVAMGSVVISTIPKVQRDYDECVSEAKTVP